MIIPNEVCPICNANPNIQYICESCREIFCEDCVELHAEEHFVCITCGGNEISFDKYDRPFCQACGSADLRSVNKVIPTCRTCESTQIIRIEEKQKDLLEEYKKIITNSRQFLIPLEGTLERHHHLRNKLLELRQGFPPCHHYPNLESDALLLFKLYDNGKNRVYEQANRFFQEIQRNIHYINEIQTTHPSNLLYVSEILLHFERERKKVENLARNEVEPLNSRLEPLEKEVEFMERMQVLFNFYLPKMNMEREERIVFGLNCKLSSGANSEQGFSNKNGTILITNRRIYFYHEQGVFKKQTVLLFSVQLADLQATEVKGKLKKKVSLQFLNSMYDFSLSKGKRATLVEWIERAQEFDLKNTVNETNFKKFIKYRLTTKLFNEELENAIYNLVGYHGYRNPIPSQGRSPNSNIFNPQMFRSGQLGNPQNRSAYRSQRPRMDSMNSMNTMNSPNSNNFIQSPYVSNPNPHTSFRGGPRSTASYPQSTSMPNSPQPRFDAQTGAPLPQNPMNSSRYPSSSQPNSWDQNISQGGSTPRGHYGYPHDKTPPFRARNSNFPRNSPPYSSPNTSRYSPGSDGRTYFNQNAFQEPFSSNSSGYDPRTRSPFPSQPNNPFQTDRPYPSFPSYSSGASFPDSQNSTSQEMTIRAELNRLRSDQYAFQTTLQKLEYQYEQGAISNPEFVGSYQDLVQEYYDISDKISHLEGILHDNYEF